MHPNMRGHSGGQLSLQMGFLIVSSTKQNLNTRSSTEAEIVAADDFMSAICWTRHRHFMMAQGYVIKDNVLFQDNKSAMLLIKNRTASSSRRTKHINIRYFFINDYVSKGEIKIEWCPTADMIGDYMTKPLQGQSFRKFWDLIMGVKTNSWPKKPKSFVWPHRFPFKNDATGVCWSKWKSKKFMCVYVNKCIFGEHRRSDNQDQQTRENKKRTKEEKK